MIKVNLIGSGRKKATKASASFSMPTNFVPVLLVAIALGFAGGGYFWYSSLTGESSRLDEEIRKQEAERAKLEEAIKRDQQYEGLKKKFETRKKVVEGLVKNKLSPVLALDQLSEAVQKTQYVWLSSLDQKDAILNMNGVGTSLSAIADFYTNLSGTGYFKNIELGTSQENSGNFTFSLKCEFAPPRPAPTGAQPATAGGN